MTGLGTTSADVASSERSLRRADVILHELDDEALIFDATSSDTHRLNGTAYFIWQCCDGTHDLAAIARRVSETFEVSAESALTYVREMIGLFHERNLLETGGASGTHPT